MLFRSSTALTADPSRRRPDVIAEVRSGNTSTMYCIECKGTGGTSLQSKQQLKSGLGQVSGILVNGLPVRSFVVGTRYTPDRIALSIVDPEADPVLLEGMNEVAPQGPLISRGALAKGSINVSSDLLAQRLVAVTSSRCLREAGAVARSAELLGDERLGDDPFPPDFAPSKFRVEGCEQNLVGRELTIEVSGEKFVARRGVDAELVGRIMEIGRAHV